MPKIGKPNLKNKYRNFSSEKSSPMHGKNVAQRNRVSGGFTMMMPARSGLYPER